MNKCLLLMLFHLMLFGNALLAQERIVSIQITKEPLRVILENITEQTGLPFSYSADMIDIQQKLSIHVKTASLEQTLKQLFSTTNIQYSIQKNQVILFPAKSKTISGYIRESGTGELLIGASVSTIPNYAGCATNGYGFFSITVPDDSFALQVNYIGYRREIITLQALKKENTIYLEPNANLDEVVISASNDFDNLDLNQTDVPIGEIRNVPMILGEKDVVKYIMLSPGVQKGNEGNGYIYVRGGGPDQNLIMIDDAIIYNAYHFLGLASLFTGSELRKAALIKGGFSSKFGGRLSSVLDMSMKDGNNQKHGLEASIGSISSKILIEGPLIKDKASYLLSFRKSYIDKMAETFAPQAESVLNYGYLDFHSKVSANIGKHDRIMLGAYLGNDRLINQTEGGFSSDEDGIQWGNRAISFRWNHRFNEQVFINTSLVNSYYTARIAYGEIDYNTGNKSSSAVESRINDLTLKSDLEFTLDKKNQFKAGAGYTIHQFSSLTSLTAITVNKINENKSITSANEANAYTEWDFRPFQKWEIITGIRYSYYFNELAFHRLEPRISIGYRTFTNWEFKTSYTIMNQYLHLVSAFNGIGIPSDAWISSDKNLKPQNSEMVTLGMSKNNIAGTWLSFSVELYGKQIANAVNLKEGASFYQVLPLPYFNKQANSWSDMVTQGNANSFGSEFMVKKSGKYFDGHISYTLSKTTMQFDAINFGEAFPATYDRRHDVGTYLSYKSNKHIKLSAVWVYGTGNAITLPTGEYFQTINDPVFGNYTLTNYTYGKKNSTRMQSYHRLDLSFMYMHTLDIGIESTIELSIYNVYNRANPFFYQIEYENSQAGTGVRKLQKMSLFPLMPSLSWTLKF